MKKTLKIRKKPSFRIKKTKESIQIIKTLYDEFGKVIKKEIEAIKK